MDKLDGQTAFITGGVSGIGLGLAKACRQAGMNVILTYRRADHRDAALKEMLRLPGQGSVHALELDVTDRGMFQSVADEGERLGGPVSLLCNNAGVNLFAPMDEVTPEDWDWVIAVNLQGVINGLLTFIPRMKRRGEGGHILNTGSMASFISSPKAGLYVTTKFAVRGLTESLRPCLAPHRIGVSLLAPGLTRTNIHESVNQRPGAERRAGTPAQELLFRRIREVHSAGMDPDDVGRKALEGVRRNDLYILTHPEFREELVSITDHIVAALPDEPVDPHRLALENARRQANQQAR